MQEGCFIITSWSVLRLCESGKERTHASGNGGLIFTKRLQCFFDVDVFCSFRRYENMHIMSRCFSCSHYRRVMCEMEEEDERVMDEIDRIRKYGYPKRF